MGRVRDAISALLSNHSIPQKVNYIKYLCAKRGEVLRYDPITISIVGTTRCTLSCDMCPTHSGIVPDEYPHKQKNVKDMDFNMFKEVIDRFPNALTVHIIGSGEPLLNKDFFRMVEYAAAKKMEVKTFSNGTTINDNIDKILSSKLDGITISLNGHDAGEFTRMTGMGGDVYKEIYGATRRLIEERNKTRSRVKVKLSFIIDRHNYKHIPQMMDTALALGADHTFFCNFLAAPYEGISADERLLTADKGAISEIAEAFAKYPADVRKRFTLPVPVDAALNTNACRTHFTQIRFDGDGNVSSCSMMLLNMTGNGSYADANVWNNAFFRKMRRIFLSADSKDLPEPCRVCPDNKGVKIQ